VSYKQNLEMTVVFDNKPYNRNLETSWGFSCLIQGKEKSILFDTGANGQILLSNLNKLGIQSDKIDLVVLSHNHKDHTGGLEAILEQNPKIEVWMPHFFPSEFKTKIKKRGAQVKEVDRHEQICDGVFTTGVVNGWIKEQSLILETNKGLIVMTGCAHPRIVKILTLTKYLFHKNIFLVLGGFHLAGFDKQEIKEIIARFRELGVTQVGPAHCSGDEARELFAQEYKNDFITIGVGKKIKIQ